MGTGDGERRGALPPARARYGPTVLVLLLYSALAIFMTWPLARHMADSVMGGVGDTFYFVWLLDWFRETLFVDALHTGRMNYPEGWSLAYNEVTPASALAVFPVTLVAGPIVGYNLSMLLSFPLSGLGLYLWVVRLTGNRGAALVAGAIFAFVPYRMSHMLWHLNLMGTQWFPFFFLSLDALLRAPRLSRKAAALAALFLGLIALTSPYYLYMTGMAALLYLIARRIVYGRRSLDGRWRRLAAVGVASLPMVVAAMVPYLQLRAGGTLDAHDFGEVSHWSASPTDFVVPTPMHFLWGDWIGARFVLWTENTLYLGAVTLALGAVALLAARRRAAGWRVTRVAALTAAALFVLALGTDLHWLGAPIRLDTPELLQRWYPHEKLPIPLPGFLLYRLLPFYGNMRVWMRYGILVALFAALVAGIGAAWLLRRLPARYRAPGVAALLALALFDFYAGAVPLVRVEGRPVDHWLAAQPGDGAVIQFPLEQSGEPQQAYYTLVHGKPFAGGFFSAYQPPQFEALWSELADFPNPDALAHLRSLDIQWLVVDVGRYGDGGASLDAGLAALGVRRAAEIGGMVVYRLR